VADELRIAIAALIPRLRRFGIALTGSAPDADDLVRSVCERALREPDRPRHHARLEIWALGIMRTLWDDENRARKPCRHEAPAAADGPEATTEDHMTLAAVRRSLAALPAEHRTVLILVCVDGLSYREVAAILDVPIGTVVSRLARGRQALHEQLAEQRRISGNVIPLTPTARATGSLSSDEVLA
jgi:RNA polymerase sigma-70 factor, ECF subfamily